MRRLQGKGTNKNTFHVISYYDFIYKRKGCKPHTNRLIVETLYSQISLLGNIVGYIMVDLGQRES